MKKLFIVATCALLLTACTNEEPKEVVRSEESRFVPDGHVKFTTDTKTGCEYIANTGVSTRWTYVHGSCSEIIAEENGITNSK